MKSKEEFKLQLLALGMKPKEEKSIDVLYDEFQKSEGESNQLADLFQQLEPEKLDLVWDESEYEPEASLKKRCVNLSEDFVSQANGKYPMKVDEDCGDAWHHLVMHGKCGLMALLFSLEKAGGLTCEKIAPMIETFMTKIDEAFDQCLLQKNRDVIAKSLRISNDESLDFDSFIKGRLQAFSLMRSLYLEDKTKNLSPLQWWVQHERFIPALPE